MRHEWYLSLLAYLEAISRGLMAPVASRVHPEPGYVGDIKALYERRTSRVFTADELPLQTVESLLQRVFADDRPGPDVTLAVWNVNGLRSGLYRWESGEPWRLGEAPLREQVTKNCAGQTAASGGALAVWISSLTEIGQPARYVMDLVDLGRLGQRLCAAAAELGIAVFLTPAVHDRGTCELLWLDDAERRLTYVFGLGVKPGSANALTGPDVTAVRTES